MAADPTGGFGDPFPGGGTVDFDKVTVWTVTAAKKETDSDVKWTKDAGNSFYMINVQVFWQTKVEGVWTDKQTLNGNGVGAPEPVNPWKNVKLTLDKSGAMIVRTTLITVKNGKFYSVKTESARKIVDLTANTVEDAPE